MGIASYLRLFLTFGLILGLSLSLVSSAQAGTLLDTKVGLHVKAPPGRGQFVCGTHNPISPCSQYNTQGDVGVSQYVYLVAANVDSAIGLKALSCGIDYDPVPGQGLDVIQWFFCADGLQFNNAGPNGVWPASGGGNRMTWLTCQESEIPPDGAHAVFGAFSVYAYGQDTLKVTPNLNIVSGPEFDVVNCSLASAHLNPALAAGQAVFSPGAVDPGYNPCLGGPAGCSVSTTHLVFSHVVPGQFEDDSFTITNILASDNLTGEVSSNCPEFEVITGGGPYDLLPGEVLTVVVRFSPDVAGTYQCVLETGTECPPINLLGSTLGCQISTTGLQFGAVPLGQSLDGSFTITNSPLPGVPDLVGTVSESCPDFEIISGASYDLAPGESQSVTVRFTPTSIGPTFCEVESGNFCQNFTIQAAGGIPSGVPPKAALHAQPLPNSLNVCTTDAPAIPCSEYTVNSTLNQATHVYLMVARVDAVLGIEAFSCGIDYDPVPGQGVDVTQWLGCAEGTSFLGVGPNGQWPAAESGYRLVWNDCQQDGVLPPDGQHALVGAFYVYAYGSDELAVTPNYIGSPGGELAIFNCLGMKEYMSASTDAGSVAFSSGAVVRGTNPCLDQIQATAAEVSPNTLNQASNGKWITAQVKLPQEYDPADVLVETVRIQGSVVADMSFPAFDPAKEVDFNENGILDLTFKFDRGAFVQTLPPGEDSVEVEVRGEIGTSAVFTATDMMRIVRPSLLSPNGGEDLMAGTFIEILWENPAGWTPTLATLSFSTDAGSSWNLITDRATGNRHFWRVPGEDHEAVLIRVEVYDEHGFLGVDLSDAPFSTTVQVVGINDPTTLRPGLLQNAPNPFSGSTVIQYALDRDSHVSLNVFNIRGQLVRVLVDQWTPAGVYEARWNGRDQAGNPAASGIYLYRLKSGNLQETKRMILAH